MTFEEQQAIRSRERSAFIRGLTILNPILTLAQAEQMADEHFPVLRLALIEAHAVSVSGMAG